jgi:hypothetical protein
MDTASEAEIDAEMDNLDALADQMRVFLGFLFDPDFEYSPSLLKGSKMSFSIAKSSNIWMRLNLKLAKKNSFRS